MFSNKVLKKIVSGLISITPGLLQTDDDDSVIVDVDNETIEVKVSCMYDVNYYEAMLMARNLIVHSIRSYTSYSDYKINVCLKLIK